KAHLSSQEPTQVSSDQWHRIEQFATNAPYTQLKSFLSYKVSLAQKSTKKMKNKDSGRMIQDKAADCNNNQDSDAKTEPEEDTANSTSSGLVQQLATELNSVSIE